MHVSLTGILSNNFAQLVTKVSTEKEAADEEQRRVAIIEVEVGKRRMECEEDLVKAEPALQAAKEALNTLNKVHVFI